MLILLSSVRGASSGSSDIPLLFSDDFESGGLTHTENGIAWANSNNTSVSTQNSNGGTRSLRFAFNGVAPGSDSIAEQRFSITSPLNEIRLEFDLYFPDGTEGYGGAAYEIRSGESPDNNKFMRLWRGDTSDGNNGYSSHYFKTGAEDRRGDGVLNNVYPSYGVNGGPIGPRGSDGLGPTFSTDPFIVSADLGTWVAVKFYSKCATSANNDGIIRVYKNGTLFGEVTTLPIYPSGGASQNGFAFGYLLGHANSGFTSTTYLFIDNFKIYGQ